MITESLNKVLYSSVLDIEKVKGLVKKSFDDEIRTLNIKALSDTDTKELVDWVKEDKMKEALESQALKASTFFKSVNEKPKNKKKGNKE